MQQVWQDKGEWGGACVCVRSSAKKKQLLVHDNTCAKDMAQEGLDKY